MLELEESVHITVPVGIVFDYTTDYRNNAAWQTGIIRIEPTSNVIRGPGASFRCINLFLGMRMETEVVVEAYQPHKFFVYRAANGHISGRNTFLYESSGGYTRFTTQAKISLGMMGVVNAFMRPLVRNQVKTDLNKLKQILEASHLERQEERGDFSD